MNSARVVPLMFNPLPRSGIGCAGVRTPCGQDGSATGGPDTPRPLRATDWPVTKDRHAPDASAAQARLGLPQHPVATADSPPWCHPGTSTPRDVGHPDGCRPSTPSTALGGAAGPNVTRSPKRESLPNARNRPAATPAWDRFDAECQPTSPTLRVECRDRDQRPHKPHQLRHPHLQPHLDACEPLRLTVHASGGQQRHGRGRGWAGNLPPAPLASDRDPEPTTQAAAPVQPRHGAPHRRLRTRWTLALGGEGVSSDGSRDGDLGGVGLEPGVEGEQFGGECPCCVG